MAIVQDLKDSRLIERSPTNKPNIEVEVEERIQEPNESIIERLDII